MDTITTEFKDKTAKEVCNNLEIKVSLDKTYIIVVAVNRDLSKNLISRISCKKGIPILGYVYDSQTDSYCIECSDYLHLGFIPVSFKGKMKGLKDWQVSIPMPESVIKKYLTSMQKKELKNFRNSFKDDVFEIQYIQMVDPN